MHSHSHSRTCYTESFNILAVGNGLVDVHQSDVCLHGCEWWGVGCLLEGDDNFAIRDWVFVVDELWLGSGFAFVPYGCEAIFLRCGLLGFGCFIGWLSCGVAVGFSRGGCFLIGCRFGVGRDGGGSVVLAKCSYLGFQVCDLVGLLSKGNQEVVTDGVHFERVLVVKAVPHLQEEFVVFGDDFVRELRHVGSDFHVDPEVVSAGAGSSGGDLVDSFIVASVVGFGFVRFEALVAFRGCLT